MSEHASAGDLANVEKVVWTYLDGLHEGNTQKLASAFHEVSHLYALGPDGVTDVPRADWLKMVASRPSPKSQALESQPPEPRPQAPEPQPPDRA